MGQSAAPLLDVTQLFDGARVPTMETLLSRMQRYVRRTQRAADRRRLNAPRAKSDQSDDMFGNSFTARIRVRRTDAARPLRVVAADDHPVVLSGIDQLFDRENDIELVAKCTDGEQALEAVRKHKPDILLLDLHMKKLDGLSVLRQLQAEKSATQAVVLTAHVNEDEMIEAMRLGVRGVILKEIAPKLLVKCLRKVAAGEEWLERVSAAKALGKLLKRDAALRSFSSQLTPREIEVVRMVAGGLRNKQVAEQLAVGEGTVKGHLHNIYQKLNVQNRVELAMLARSRNLV